MSKLSNSNNPNLKNLTRLFRRLLSLEYIRPEDIPSLDLYMDQVTSFMEEHLESSKRFESDKILTKTMINNYAKNDLLPSPYKKKYSKDHMIFLIFIYYMKNIMSINDIKKLLEPIEENYFGGNGKIPLSEVYGEIIDYLKQEQDDLFLNIRKEFRASEKTFSNTSAELSDAEKEKLHRFAFICSLAFDVYLKKLMIETMIDEDFFMNEKETKNKDGKSKNQKKKES